MIDIALDKFYEARQVLKDKVLLTPIVPCHKTTPQGNPIYLKCENLQLSGSFKIRGAAYCISLIPPEKRHLGVVAYSTGNHAQGVALAARQLHMNATIVMSPGAMEFKIASTREYGAEVILVELEKRKEYTEFLAKTKGYYYVPPFDHPDVIAGQGTIGLEILECITSTAVFVPIGGGGLIAGIATAIKKSNPLVKMIGVVPELENHAMLSFKAETRLSGGGKSNSIADAVKVPSLGELTFPLIEKYVDDIIAVSEQQIVQATLASNEKVHLFTEPSGALALAGALCYQGKLPSGPVVCINSGGNTTLNQLTLLVQK